MYRYIYIHILQPLRPFSRLSQPLLSWEGTTSMTIIQFSFHIGFRFRVEVGGLTFALKMGQAKARV